MFSYRISIVLFLFTSALMGCSSTQTYRSETREPTLCDPEGCRPDEHRISKAWGPVQLEGALSFLNLENIADFIDKVDDARLFANYHVNRKASKSEYQCSEECRQRDTRQYTTTLSINPDNTQSDESCDKLFAESVLIVAEKQFIKHLTYLSLLSEVEHYIGNLGETCRQLTNNEQCGVKSITIDKDADKLIQDGTDPKTGREVLFFNEVVTVQCGNNGGKEKIASPSVNGTTTLTRICEKPESKQCEQILNMVSTQ